MGIDSSLKLCTYEVIFGLCIFQKCQATSWNMNDLRGCWSPATTVCDHPYSRHASKSKHGQILCVTSCCRRWITMFSSRESNVSKSTTLEVKGSTLHIHPSIASDASPEQGDPGVWNVNFCLMWLCENMSFFLFWKTTFAIQDRLLSFVSTNQNERFS